MTSPSWNPAQYLKFSDERSRPARDVLAAISIDAPQRVIDLGCGPGNSTQLLSERWPNAEIIALDSSADMVEAARAALPQRVQVIQADISAWTAQDDADNDVIFSNAVMHWLPDHRALFPALLARVRSGGVLAVQMPNQPDAPQHRVAAELRESGSWRNEFGDVIVSRWHSHPPEFFYEVLAPRCARVELWRTTYFHVLPNVEAITEWYAGSGFRPYLDALRTRSARERFLDECTAALRPHYPARADGRVLLPFERLFLVATAR